MRVSKGWDDQGCPYCHPVPKKVRVFKDLKRKDSQRYWLLQSEKNEN